jgi:hypothetical protein
MTESLEADDLELHKRYDAEQEEIEALPPAAIELPADQALALVTHIQIAAANPALKLNPLLPCAIAAAKHIQEYFNRDSAIYELLQLGWAAQRSGEQHSIFTTAITRVKRDEPQPYYPDDHHHF